MDGAPIAAIRKILQVSTWNLNMVVDQSGPQQCRDLKGWSLHQNYYCPHPSTVAGQGAGHRPISFSQNHRKGPETLVMLWTYVLALDSLFWTHKEGSPNSGTPYIALGLCTAAEIPGNTAASDQASSGQRTSARILA